jgi:POT family proton-dependent oligopeptide transporter
VADRFFGKYNTILWFSLVYCARARVPGAVRAQRASGFFTGLGSDRASVRAVSSRWWRRSSAISSTQANKHLAKIVFDAFYWIINFGSLFASLLMPLFLKHYGRVAWHSAFPAC